MTHFALYNKFSELKALSMFYNKSTINLTNCVNFIQYLYLRQIVELLIMGTKNTTFLTWWFISSL